tara:strand:- start:479 stop:991 length:513 start_codon:yes stop_codon:yes gene_type:complete
MQLKDVKHYLNKFAKEVIKQARTRLTKGKKVVTRELYDSLEYEINQTPEGITVAFFMEQYGLFQDKGVSGKKRKYGTPYSYKSKMPPPSALDQWIVRKGIAPRDKKGKFIKRKSLQYMIARSIFLKGIKPSLFFTKPFEMYYDKLKVKLPKEFAKDAENSWKHIFQTETI